MAKRTEADDMPADGGDDEDREPAALAQAAQELYAAPPDRFLDLRAALAAQLRAQGETDAAKRLARLRKPTTAAWIVNRQTREDDTVVERILDLNDRLRAAHDELDADLLRTLSAERRALVDELTRAALASAGRSEAPAQLRDEVRSTFDAAVADPSITVRLGRLQRSQSWSGFGVAPATGPALTVLRGGRDRLPAERASGKRSAPATPDKPAKPSRALTAAREALAGAESDAQAAAADEHSWSDRVGSLTAKLSELEADLDRARGQLERARKAAKAARARRREAQAAVNRAERASRR